MECDLRATSQAHLLPHSHPPTSDSEPCQDFAASPQSSTPRVVGMLVTKNNGGGGEGAKEAALTKAHLHAQVVTHTGHTLAGNTLTIPSKRRCRHTSRHHQGHSTRTHIHTIVQSQKDTQRPSSVTHRVIFGCSVGDVYTQLHSCTQTPTQTPPPARTCCSRTLFLCFGSGGDARLVCSYL